MKKEWVAVLSTSVSFLALAGASVGLYYGTKPAPVTMELDENVAEMFASESPKGTTALENLSSPLLEKGFEVSFQEKEKKAFYYALVSDDTDYGAVKFAVGIEEGTVKYYSYLSDNGADDLGASQVNGNKDLFVGYKLGGADVMAGVTAEYTYTGMKTAVDAALKDAEGRK